MNKKNKKKLKIYIVGMITGVALIKVPPIAYGAVSKVSVWINENNEAELERIKEQNRSIMRRRIENLERRTGGYYDPIISQMIHDGNVAIEEGILIDLDYNIYAGDLEKAKSK